MAKESRAPTGAGEAAFLMGGLSLAPLVIMMRLPLLAAEAQKGRGRGVETARAVMEISAALAEGAAAAQLALAQACWGLWPELMSGRVPSLWSGAAARQSAEAAMRPASRRVKANFKRLSKRKA